VRHYKLIDIMIFAITCLALVASALGKSQLKKFARKVMGEQNIYIYKLQNLNKELYVS